MLVELNVKNGGRKETHILRDLLPETKRELTQW